MYNMSSNIIPDSNPRSPQEADRMELKKRIQNTAAGTKNVFMTPWEEKETSSTEKGSLHPKVQGGLHSGAIKPWKEGNQTSPKGASSTPNIAGGIRERIIALQSAARMSELDLVPVKESLKKEQSFSRSTGLRKAVKSGVLRERDGKSEENIGIEACKQTGDLIRTVEDLPGQFPQVQHTKSASIAFEVDLGETGRKGIPPRVPARFKDKSPTNKETTFHSQSKANELNVAPKSPTKRKGVLGVKAALKSPMKRKGEDEVRFYLSPKIKEKKQDSLSSEHTILSEMRDSSDHDSQELSPKSKAVAFEINFGDKSSQQHRRTSIKHTPFRLKRFQAGKRSVGNESQATQPLGNSDTRYNGSLDKTSSRTVDSISDQEESQILKDTVQVQGKNGQDYASKKVRSKPSLLRRGTYEFEKFPSVCESVTKQGDDGRDILNAKLPSVENLSVSCKAQVMKGEHVSEEVSTLSQYSTEQRDKVTCPQDVAASTGIPSLDKKRKTLIRSETYNADKVLSALESVTQETLDVLGRESKELAPNCSRQASSKRYATEVEKLSGDELSDGDDDDGFNAAAHEQLCSSINSPENPRNPGDVGNSLGEVANSIESACYEDLKVQIHENCDPHYVSCQQCHFVPDVTTSPNPEQEVDAVEQKPTQCCKEKKWLVTSTNQATCALDKVAHVLEKADLEGGNVVQPLQHFAATEHSTELNIPQEQRLTMQDASLDECTATGASNELASPTELLVAKEQGKRRTYSLDEFAEILEESSDGDDVAQVLDVLACSTEMVVSEDQDSSLSLPGKRGTFTFNEVTETLERKRSHGDDAVVELLDELAFSVEMLVSENQEHSSFVPGKRGTYTLDEVADTIKQKSSEGNAVVEVLDELDCSVEMSVSDNQEHSLAAPGKRATYTLDEVADTLAQRRSEGGDVADVLNALACSVEMSVSDNQQSSATLGKRGTYTLDEVVQALEEASAKGRTFEESLGKVSTFSSSGQLFNTDKKSVTEPVQRGTYTLDEVANALDKASNDGGSVIEALECLSQEQQSSAVKGRPDTMSGCPQRDTCAPFIVNESTPRCKLDEREDSWVSMAEPIEKRRTYTLDEVSVALQAADKDGIPLVHALENLTKVQEGGSQGYGRLGGGLIEAERHESLDSVGHSQQSLLGPGASAGAGDRATYTLEGVSHCLEAAQSKGLPLVDALASLACRQEASEVPQCLSTPKNRGTYTLDHVSHSMEVAKEKGLPIVELLDRLAGSGEEVTKRTPDAMHRRQQKLVNRKTYAMATPLETIGENANLKLFDGSSRRMLSPVAVEKLLEKNKKEPGATKSKQTRELVETLDFLTSACEVLLSTTAKTTADGIQHQKSSFENRDRGVPCSVVSGNSSKSSKVDRKTYSLEDVALTIEGAKEAGLPIIEALKKLSLGQLESGTKVPPFTNLTRYASKSDSALAAAAKDTENTDRHTHSMEDMSQVLENAGASGLSVIEALDQLTKDLIRFKVANIEVKSRGKKTCNQSFVSNSRTERRCRMGERTASSLVSDAEENCFPLLLHKAYSLDSVVSTTGQPCESRVPVIKTSNLSETHPDVQQGDSKRGTYTLENVSTSLDSAKTNGLSIVDALEKISAEPKGKYNQNNASLTDGGILHCPASGEEHRRTLSLDQTEQSLDSAMKKGLPIVGVLGDMAQMLEIQQDNDDKPTPEVKIFSCVDSKINENSRTVSSAALGHNGSPPTKPWKNRNQGRTCPPKPERKAVKKAAVDLNADPFFVAIFSNLGNHSSESDACVDDEILQLSNETSLNQIGSSSKTPQKDVSGSGTSENSPTSEVDFIDQSTPRKRNKETLGRRSSDQTDANLGFETSEDVGAKVVGRPSPSQTVSTKSRAMWRASGSVLDKISSLLDSAEESGLSAEVALECAAHYCTDEGEIEEGDDDTEDKSQVVTSQMTLLRMQLEEKRHHIEAEKRRSQEQWEEQRRQVGHTAFWYMMGKARGAGQELIEGPGAKGQVPCSNNMTSPNLHQPRESPRPQPMSHNTDEVQPNPLGSPDANTLPEQRSPPIARSSPIGSPVAWQQVGTAQEQEYETREFRLSNLPPDSQEVRDLPTDGSTQPQSARKCWGVNPTTPTSPAPFSPPRQSAIPGEVPSTGGSGVSSPPPSNEVQVTPPWKDVAVSPALQQFTVPSDEPGESSFSTPCGTSEVQVPHPWKGVATSPAPFTPPQQFAVPSEIAGAVGGSGVSTPQLPSEVEITPQPPSEVDITPQRKGLALFVGEESSFESMTPEQLKKRERFLRQRQKKQEEEKARKVDELEKKRRRETQQREEAIKRMEEEKQRSQAEERKISRVRPQDRATPSRESRPSQTPEGYSTYRATTVSRAKHEAHEDVSSSPSGQKSGFTDFSGPQCYVKPSGKSNRKIIMNAISYVCLSGTVNKDQKDKCLRAIAESGGYNFMVLFKDGLKFRGLYSYNPESDQAFKIFGIGPRVLTGKMVENLYKYNSGGKEFTKIFAKTLSISIDGLSIQKTYWQTNKPVVQSKTMSNLKRAPKPVQR